MKGKYYFLIWICLVSLVLSFTFCKRKENLRETFDPVWRDESTKIALSICEQILTCFQKKFIESQSLPVYKHVERNLQSSKCTEKHKKSNVYLLRGNEPETIKKNFLTCYQKLQNLNCEEIYKDEIAKISECRWISNLQKL
ncbi:MAG: hypothetical protein N3A69_12335 [Leptospiraceae bacterium]|nr:hypothetical protein [Leptospiraceae bacterium]